MFFFFFSFFFPFFFFSFFFFWQNFIGSFKTFFVASMISNILLSLQEYFSTKCKQPMVLTVFLCILHCSDLTDMYNFEVGGRMLYTTFMVKLILLRFIYWMSSHIICLPLMFFFLVLFRLSYIYIYDIILFAIFINKECSILVIEQI